MALSSFTAPKSMQGVVLVTAGPTRAYLDDVRYVSNYSSGALGFEICKALKKAGFKVVAVVGPTSFPFAKLKLSVLYEVETPEEMEAAVLRLIQTHKPYTGIFAAAVLDFVPEKKRQGKMSSATQSWTIRLVPTRKIIDVVGKKFPGVRRIGFKLEAAPRSRKYVESYLKKKGLEALCFNQLKQIGYQKHTATLFRKTGEPQRLLTKRAIAKALTRFVMSLRTE